MSRRVLRSTLAWVVLGAVGCATSGNGCGGCSEPIPGGFPLDKRTNNAITTKVSRDGLKFFEQRVNDIIGVIATNGLEFQVPCMDQSQSFDILGLTTVDVPVFACDHSSNASCGDEVSGSSVPPSRDEQSPLSPKLKACQAKAAVKALKITPTQATDTSPVNVNVQLEVRVNTGAIPIFAKVPNVCEINCAIEYDSNKAAPADVPVKVDLNLKLDPNYGDILAFDVGNVDVQQVFDPSDLQLSRVEGICSYVCDLVNIDFVKEMALRFLRGRINLEIKNVVDTFRCRPCEAVTNNCPSNSHCEADQGVCYVEYKPDSDPAKDKRICPPAQLGLEGRVGVGQFMAAFGAPTNSVLDLYAVAGGRNTDGKPSAQVQTGGIVVAIMGGSRPAVRDRNGNVIAPGVAACVPPREWIERAPQRPIDFDAEALAAANGGTGFSDYHLGLALSDNFLDKSLFDAYQAGLLCLNVDSSLSTFLSSALFRTFLPSLGVLTQGQDVPMLVALRPKEQPSIIVGKGTTKRVDGEEVPDDPLLTIEMKQVQIDFYGLVEERYARLFSLTTDIRLPLSLKFNASLNTVQPILASLETAVSNIQAENSEMLAENPQIVAELLDAIIGLVQPILASVLAPVELPTFNGFKLVVRDARGAVKYEGVQPGYEHLALFANLNLSAPLVATVETDAELFDAHVPALADVRAHGHRPFAVVDVRGLGLRHNFFQGYEYSWRVDGGLWSPFTTRERIEVHAPVLMLPGRHEIEVMAREIGTPETEDLTPAKVPFLVDYAAPQVRLELDAETRDIRTIVADDVSRADELSFRYRAAGADWSMPGAPQVFRLEDLGADPSLEVEVTDLAGHVAIATFGTPAAQLGEPDPDASGLAQAGGCAHTAAPALALAALGLLARRRRRS